MNIKKRMTIGLAALFAFSLVIGIIGMTQINMLDGNITDFTQKDMVILETVDTMLYEAELIIRETLETIYGGEEHGHHNETAEEEAIIDHILEHAEVFNSSLELLEKLHPEHSEELLRISEDFDCIIDDITSEEHGIIVHVEEINEFLNESVEIREQIDILITDLIGLVDDFYMKFNATMLKNYLSEQIYLTFEYLKGICAEAGLEFNESVDAFDNVIEVIDSFYAGDPLIIPKLVEIESAHHNFAYMVNGEEGIFDMKDHIDILLADVESDYEGLSADLNGIRHETEIELDQGINSAQLGVMTSYIITVIAFIACLAFGIVIAVPTVRGIVRVTSNMEKVLKAGSEASKAVLKYAEFSTSSKAIFDACTEIIGASSGFIALLNPDKKENRVIFLNSGEYISTVDLDIPMPIRGMSGEVVKSKIPLYNNNFPETDWIQFLQNGHVDLENIMFTPLLVNDEVQGLMGLANKSGGFTDDDMNLAMTLTEFVSIALQNSQTLESFEKSEKRNKNLSNELEQQVFERTKELKESRKNFKLLYENAPLGYQSLDDKGNILEVNKTWLDFFGYSKDEVIGKWIGDFIDSEYLKVLETNFPKFKEEGIIQGLEYEILKKDGSHAIVSFNGKISYDKNGNFKQTYCIFTDITERKMIEEEINRPYSELNQIFNISIPLCVIDKNHDIIQINENYASLIGINKEEIIGRKCYDVWGGKNCHTPKCSLKMVMDGKDQWKYEKERTIGESKITCIMEGFPFKSPQGEVIGIIENFIDVTEKKEVERLILEENEKLQELSQMRQDLITRISHELKTPLTSIYGVSQAFLEIPEEELNEEILEYREIAHRGCIRLKELIDNLLDASRLDSKRIELRIRKENLVELIKEYVIDMMYWVNNRKHTLTTDLPKELFFEIDKIKFSQAFINLISNAIKNTPMGGKIFISADDTTDYIDIQVRDTGVGLTEKEKEILFQKFGKIERYGKDLGVEIEGAGLGLYISKEIIELHGGKIFVESEGRNEGATFTIRLFKNK